MNKYLPSGMEVEVIAQTDRGFIVAPVFEQGGGEPYVDTNDLRIVPQVVDSPLDYRQHQQIKDLEGRITALRNELLGLEQETMAAKNEKAALLQAVSQNKALRHIADFLAGKITHYVVFGWEGPEIITFKDALCESSDNWSKKPKLLTLFGDSKGDLGWNLNRYKDGSGSSYEVIPCLGYEEAVAEVKEWVAGKLATDVSGRYMGYADKWGVPVPFEYRKQVLEGRASEFKNAMEQQRRLMEANEAQLNQVLAQLTANFPTKPE
jgi:hypothetical protein